jgi:hypothetical protein
VAVGKALLNAKQGYYLSMGSNGPLDEKSMIESTLYGLPMYQIDPDTPSPTAPTDPANLVVTINQVTADNLPIGQIQQQILLTEKSTDNGQFYLSDDETAFVPYRPIQPQKTIPIAVDGQVAHGVLLTGGTYQDISDFNPVIGRPIWDLSIYEPQFINGAWYPSRLQTIMSLRTPQGLKQTLVVVPGQFITTSADTQVIGTERLYGSLDYTVYYSSSSDYTKPDINRVDITPTGDISVIVVDNGQVNRVVVTWTAGTGDNQWRTFDLTQNPTSGTWTGTFPVPPAGGLVDFIVQAVDDAGNVGMNPSSGVFNPSVIIMETGVNHTAYEGGTVYFQGALIGPVQVQRIAWDFGDGSSASDTLAPNHKYSSDGQYTVTLTVNDTSGAVFTDVFIVTVKNIAPVVSPICAPVAPVPVAQTVNTSATFKDMGALDVHTAVWNWGDGVSSEAEIIEQNGAGSTTGEHVYNSIGVYTVILAVTDDQGLTTSCQAVITVVDITPPDTFASITPSPDINGWNSSNVIVGLNSFDSGSGVREIHYSTNGGPQNIVSGNSTSFVISDRDVSIITYFALDNAGNIEASKSLNVKICDYGFIDSIRGTKLYIVVSNQTFQFITPDREYPIKKATSMKVIDLTKVSAVIYNLKIKKWSIDTSKLNLDRELKPLVSQWQCDDKPTKLILISHRDADLLLYSLVIDGKQDSCLAYAMDLKTRKIYQLIVIPKLK